jgi:hypothetical protein
MLEAADEYGHELKRDDRVQLAIWFHDVVYKVASPTLISLLLATHSVVHLVMIIGWQDG